MKNAAKQMAGWVVVLAVVGLASEALAAGAVKKQPKEYSGVVNLNSATADELDKLPGIGPKTAKLIVDYRAKTPFKKPEEVVRVKGVGKGLLKQIKGHISVEGPTTLSVKAAKPDAASSQEAAAKEAAPKPAGQVQGRALPTRAGSHPASAK